jgi:hypothetical protein
MKQLTLLSILALLLLSACAPSAEAVPTAFPPTQALGMPDQFTGRLKELLEEGSTLRAMTAQGAAFEEFGQQLERAKGAYSNALAAQSAERNIRPEAIAELDAAFTGWDLAFSVWDAKLNGGEAPRAPDVGGYAELATYVGAEKLPMVGRGSESYVDPDVVIRILLDLAAEHFEAAKAVLIEQTQ